jgi:hypothetical protein
MIKGLQHHLPDVVRPEKTVCFTVEVPDDPWYLRAWYGTFFELASPRVWDNDPSHTALEVARVWLEIALKLKPGCQTPGSAGAGGGDEFMLRQNPDNPCLLESSVDGMTWCEWADLSKCLTSNPPQPGPGGSGPVPGTTQQYCLTLDANGQALLPIAVQGDWTLELVNKQGGWTDGGGSWKCPNGQSYTAGLCTGLVGYNGGDPLPTAAHMGIVAEIDTLFYDGNGLIVVPGALVDQQVTFQANDASLSDNYGTIQFCVKVTNPPVGPIFISYNFGTGPASVVSGQVVTVTATCCGGGGAGDWSINMQFSEPVRVTFVNQSGFTCSSSGHVLYMLGEHPLGTQVQQHYQDVDCGPNYWVPSQIVDLWDCETGSGQSVWTCQVKIDRA